MSSTLQNRRAMVAGRRFVTSENGTLLPLHARQGKNSPRPRRDLSLRSRFAVWERTTKEPRAVFRDPGKRFFCASSLAASVAIAIRVQAEDASGVRVGIHTIPRVVLRSGKSA